MTTVTIEETAPTGALVLAGDPFTEPELQALGARGAVRPLLPGVWARPDAADDPAVRAAALWTLGGPLLAAGWTAIGPSAAWILAGGAAPGRLHAAVPHFHRRPAGGGLLPWTLTDVTRVLSENHVNILSASVNTTRDRVAMSRFVFEMGDPRFLGHVIDAVRRIDGVFDVHRT